MFKRGLLVLVLCNLMLCHADNIIDNPEQLYQPEPEPEPEPVLITKITVQRTYYTINDLAASLNTMAGIQTRINSKAAGTYPPVKVWLENGSIKELLDKTAAQLGYSWELQHQIIVFSAVNPQKSVIEVSADTSPTAAKAIKSQIWVLNPKNKTLRNALTKWSKQANWQLVWNVKADYPITTTWVIPGSFETAINEVLKASQNTDVPLMAKMHDSNHVLEIFSPATTK